MRHSFFCISSIFYVVTSLKDSIVLCSVLPMVRFSFPMACNFFLLKYICYDFGSLGHHLSIYFCIC
ncbi:hypothetical protein I3843_12G022700 [Carya illinoinensis]|uniref:Uncharacterized protein n=1 Tax=Carya illinoinensis TaxID=32201 RepID=A0A922DFR5_CARIL|nr:hypothetical protein I3842_12G021500 [Carya illinoinensis]KAG7951718.1 hypothetical protein I3843_12G022700 [Carya illinoinensis]KAG7951719.1 hypothetical protein I3843_12G022700 [Carya illinoinensis]